MNFLSHIITIGIAAVIALVVLAKIGAALLTHWFILAIIIGVAVFLFAGQQIKLAIPAVFFSAIVLGILNIIVNPDPVESVEYKRNFESEKRIKKQREEEARREQEAWERAQQEINRQQEEARREQERQERERQEKERRERERQEKAAANVYNKILTDYYQAISEHRFYEAYSLLSDKEQQHQGSLEGFAAGRQDTSDIKILKFKITDERNTTVLADYQIRTKDKDGNGFIVRTFNGNVTFTKIAGTWKIDALSSKKVDERRE